MRRDTMHRKTDKTNVLVTKEAKQSEEGNTSQKSKTWAPNSGFTTQEPRALGKVAELIRELVSTSPAKKLCPVPSSSHMSVIN